MPTLRDNFLLFRGRRPALSVATVVFGTLLTIGVYVWVVYRTGDPQHLARNGPTAIRSRQTAVIVAGVVSGLYFGWCFLRALGGPFINIVLAVIPPLLAPVFVGIPFGVFAELTVAPARTAGFLVESLRMSVPGIFTFFAVLVIGDRIVLDEEWPDRHLRSVSGSRGRRAVLNPHTPGIVDGNDVLLLLRSAPVPDPVRPPNLLTDDHHDHAEPGCERRLPQRRVRENASNGVAIETADCVTDHHDRNGEAECSCDEQCLPQNGRDSLSSGRFGAVGRGRGTRPSSVGSSCED